MHGAGADVEDVILPQVETIRGAIESIVAF